VGSTPTGGTSFVYKRRTMAIRACYTDPRYLNHNIREAIRLETEIDDHLLRTTRNGKASYLISSTADVAQLLILRYTREGWKVSVGYSGANVFRLDFEDPEQTRDLATQRENRKKEMLPPPEHKSGTIRKPSSDQIFIPIKKQIP
jgi:hypothetical protein